VTKPAERVGAVILAAGEAKRFGSQKLLAQFDGRALVEHVIAAANESSLTDVVVVVGADADQVTHVAMGRARIVLNPDYATGQSSSLQAGLRALADDIDAAVVLLGDVPGVTSALIEALIAKHRETGAPAVASRWNAAMSPPVLLHRDLFGAAAALRGDVGMRDVLAGRDDVAVVEVTGDLGVLGDVDTPEDQARIIRGR
jgi:molybdenum cofactor cytidylyltransferase